MGRDPGSGVFVAVIALAMAFYRAPAAELRGVWVTSSASVDTSSPEAIVRCLVKPGMTDEQKALAIFNWYRRVIFPHAYLANDRREILRQINSYGNTLCGSHAAVLGWLMRTAGFKTRCVFIRKGGHTFLDVWYDNAWHSFDPETDFAVWSRGHPPHLINMDELKADPTLLDNPEAEGRAKPWLFKAMKFPWTTRKKMAAYCDAPETKCNKTDMQWSSCVLKGETIKDYFLQGIQTLSYSKENEPYGGHIQDTNLMQITLRPRETLIRRWDNEGKGRYILGQGFNGYPAHLLYGGGADESDEEIFKYVEPYRKDNYGIPELPVDRCYRYSGNGHLIWTPDVAAGELVRTPGITRENLVWDEASGLIRPAVTGRVGVLRIPIRSSYALVCADIRLGWIREGTADMLRLSVRGGTASPTTVWTCEKTGKGEEPIHYLKEINRAFQYELVIEMLAAQDSAHVGLTHLALDHTFVNNWLVLPHLEPGENTIRVRLDNPDALHAVELWVQYDWEEGEGWREPRSERRQVTGSPFEFILHAKGPKFPRMKAITLTALPRR